MTAPSDDPTAVEGCGAHAPGHPHTPEGLALIAAGAVHVAGTRYRFGPPLEDHWDHDPDNPWPLRHVALVRDAQVVNLAAVEPDKPYGAAWLDAARAEHDVVVDVTGADPTPGVGWYLNPDGSFVPPPDLTVAAVVDEAAQPVTHPRAFALRYTDGRHDAPASVDFTVGTGDPQTVVLEDGVAELEVPAPEQPTTVGAGGHFVIVPGRP